MTLPCILVVDDLEENVVALEALLRRDDAVVLTARSGREALEALLAHEVALALVDVQMPEMDGFELAELMRGSTRTREVPIIFVTAGLHDPGRIFRGYESGAVDFLHKPIDPVVLRSKVDVFLRLDRQKRALADQLAELRRVEAELREEHRRKDDFLALLSHELRNPLAPISNSLYLLQRAPPGSDAARRAQDVIGRQTAHLSRLVNDLLDVTRITRGKVQLQRERLDLAELVRRTAEDHRAGFAAAGVELRVTAPEPVWVAADATRIAQAIGNLLGNALKFSTRGGSAEAAVRRERGEAVVQVRDTGVGITPDVLGRIFEPFAQADQTLDRSGGGLGLGLALVRGMVELHGGTVSAASDGAGRGATFTIRLPLAPEAERATAGAAAAADGPKVRRRRVLVVEDNPDSASTLRDALESLGHEVHVSHDGLAGVEEARRLSPDVVLCDIGLPGIDGYEVARRLRKVDPRAVLVALTGYALPEDRARATAAGFSHHVAKPTSIDELDRLLAQA